MRRIIVNMIKIVFLPILLFMDQIDYGICQSNETCSCKINPSVPPSWDDQKDQIFSPCADYDFSPVECRKNNCHFRCADRHCIEKPGAATCDVQKPSDPSDGRKTCPEYCFDKCPCRAAGCDYDIVGGNCRPKDFSECKSELFEGDECRRKAIYFEGGIGCNNSIEGGNCKVIERLIAVNLNGDAFYDSYSGITYDADDTVPYTDAHNIRIGGRITGLTGKGDTQEELYATFITGDWDLNGTEKCISWEFPLTYEGKYELILKVGEFRWDFVNERNFRVKFNKVDILVELDLIQVIGEPYLVADLILQFEISDKNLNWPKGYLPSVIQDGKSELSFCYGSCAVNDTGFMVSAFAVVRYTGRPPINPPPPPPDCDSHCRKFSNSICACKTNSYEQSTNCQFNSATQQCRCGRSYCNQLELDDSICMKPGSFLVHGGVICPIPRNNQKGNCGMEKLIHAINLNGKEITVQEGIKYEADDDPSRYDDPADTRWEFAVDEPAKGDRCRTSDGPDWKETFEIYYNMIRGNNKTAKDPSNCITYKIPMDKKDGRYLLTIKTMDWHKFVNEHISNIKLNDIEILPELDILKHAGNYCRSADFLINFQITDKGSKVAVAGHTPISTPQDGVFRLAFCYGTCAKVDFGYKASAFSLMKLKPTGSEECRPSIPSSGDCDDALFEPNECRWKGKFYIKEGIPCKSRVSLGICKIKGEPNQALNLNGPRDVTDPTTGITYKSDKGVPYKDPSGTKVPGRLSGELTNVVGELAELYKTFITGSRESTGDGVCITYDIPIQESGKYELILKLAESEVSEPNQRSFKVKLNNVDIMKAEIDPYKIIGEDDTAADLVLKFERTASRLMTPRGPTLLQNGNSIPLSFCYGSCDAPNRGYLVSGFAVVSYITGEDPPPPAKNDTCDKLEEETSTPDKECRCHTSMCEFTIDPKRCINSTKLCPSILEGRKCLSKGFLAYSGAVCKAQVEKQCGMEKPIIALNLAYGEPHTGKNGIHYRKELKTDFIYKYAAYRRLQAYNYTYGRCTKINGNQQVKDGDAELYYTIVHGWSKDDLRKPENCIYYPIKIKQDGLYELGLKFIETYHKRDFAYFNVFLNNQTILSRFDTVSYVNTCIGMDVFLQFHVSNWATTLQIVGSSTPSKIISRTMNLAFCYGDRKTNCLPAEDDPNYSASAFHVARFSRKNGSKPDPPPVDECDKVSPASRPSEDKSCQCRGANCEYLVENGLCINSTKICPSTLEWRQCLRKGYLAYGGAICKMDRDDNCALEEPIIAINVNGEAHTDRNGISYKKEAESDYVFVDDPSLTKRRLYHYNESFNACKESIDNPQVKDGDAELYYTYVLGYQPAKSAQKPNYCIHYPIKITRDGMYEMGLKFLETYQQTKITFFNVRLNNQTILSRFDIDHYTARCKGLDVYVQFRVENAVSRLRIEGIDSPSKIQNRNFNLSVCYGDKLITSPKCGENPCYGLSAFYVSRYVDDLTPTIEPPTNEPPTTTDGSATESTEIPTTEIPPTDVPPTPQPRIECRPPPTSTPGGAADCEEARFYNQECRWDGKFYIQDEKPCLNTNDGGNCTVIEQIVAVNLHGDLINDEVAGIEYFADDSVKHTDPNGTRVGVSLSAYDVDGPVGELFALYSTLVVGRGLNEPAKHGGCLSYEVPLKKEGYYQLIIKLLEFEYFDAGERSFAVLFNNVQFMSEIDLVQLIGEGDKVADLVLRFELKDGNVLTTDNNSTKVQNNKVALSFCRGACNATDNAYAVSGFAVVRYTGVEGGGGNGSTTEGPPTLIPPTEITTEIPPTVPPTQQPPLQECWNFSTNFGGGGGGRLSDCEKATFQPEECHWDGKFYIRNKKPCLNTNDGGNCTVIQQIIAVNMNGDLISDEVAGIKYFADDSVKHTDPNGTRVPVSLTDDFDGPLGDLFDLYSTLVVGKGLNEPAKHGGCLSYEVPLEVEGYYQLIIKFVEFAYYEAGERSFAVLFNNMQFMSEIDLVGLIGDGDTVADLVFRFEFKNGNVLTTDKELSIVQNKRIALSFCRGICKAEDNAYAVSGFAVVRYTGIDGGNGNTTEGPTEIPTTENPITDSPPTQQPPLPECKEAPPSPSPGDCEKATFLPDECRRKGKFYIKNERPCLNSEDEGNCTVIEQMLGVNLNGDLIIDKVAGIKYFADASVKYADPNGTRKPSSISASLQGPVGELYDLYTSFVVGEGLDEPAKDGGCLTYEVPLKMDGYYQLIIKFVEPEYTDRKERSFAVLFNNMQFLPEIDLIKMIGEGDKVGDLVLRFELRNGNLLTTDKQSSTVKNNRAALSFCRGKCKADDNAYVVSGFAVVRYTKSDDSCAEVEKKQHGTLKECYCHRANCEFSVDTNFCGSAEQLCPGILDQMRCLRNDSWIGYGGVVCAATEEAINRKDQDCEIEKTLLAINVAGQVSSIKDQHGITFRKEKPTDFIYKYAKYRRVENYTETLKKCKKINSIEVERGLAQLYYTYVHGWSKTDLRKPENCLHYPIKVKEDAIYELGLKFMEVTHGDDISYFTVKLNNQTILSRFDMINYRKKKCVGMDVYVHFRVMNKASVLHIVGRSNTSAIEGKTMLLSFCYGDASEKKNCIPIHDPNYSISGLYVGKFKNQGGTGGPEECKKVNDVQGNPKKECDCHMAKCEYNEMGECKYPKDECPKLLKENKCLKQGFFVSGLVVCKTPKTTETTNEAECETDDPIIAININGPAHTDRNGIHFRAETATDYIYEYTSYRRVGGYERSFNTCKVHNNNAQLTKEGGGDTELYYTYVHGWSRSDLRKPENCIYYPISITQDGRYELGMKFMEVYHEEDISYFNVFLNGQKILSRFDMVKYRTSKCIGMDVYVQFKVKDAASFLEIEGSTGGNPIIDNKIQLSFCYGDRETNCIKKDDDPNYLINAFYVRRFKNLS